MHVTGRDGSRRWWVLGVVSLATFMTQLDNTIVVVALPSIGRQLGLGYAQLEWVVSSYILVFASLMLLGGRLADRLGNRLAFLLGVTLFSGASLMAALAGTSAVLLGARALQGAGAALIMPAALAILSAAFTDDRERRFAVGLWGAAIGAALAAGPPAGGVISQDWYWGGVFLVNVPLGAVAVAVGRQVIGRLDDGRRRGGSLDVPGVVLSFIGLFGVTYALLSRNDMGWTSPAIITSLLVALAAWIGFGFAEAKAAAPMIHIKVFQNLVYTGGTVAIFFWAMGVSGVSLFTSLYLQDVLRLSPGTAGLTYIPMALLMMLSALLSGPLARQFGAPAAVAAGYLLVTAGIILLAILGVHSHAAAVLPAFSLIGAGSGLTMPMQSAVIGAVHGNWAGVASGVLNAAREMASLLGVSVVSAIVAVRRELELRQGHTPLDAYASGYRLGLMIAAGFVLTGAFAATFSLIPWHQHMAKEEANGRW
jgi:EmrB/QacA subfamily drug resistance transporter